MEDSKKNFLHDGSFHLVIYPPTPFRCESFTIKARHFPPVDCSTFKGDTCHIYSEYFAPPSHPKLLKERNGRKPAFVEIGGLDGKPENSMTEIMERNGWDGLVIEATPGNYVQIASNRPCASVVEAAAGPSWGAVDFFGWGGCCSGAKSAMSDSFVKAFHSKKGSKERKYYRVRSAPIVDLFLAWGKDFVDFWVLDVEGGERQVLEGMDFDKVEVGMIMIEVSQQGGDIKEVEDLLAAAGFFKAEDFKSWNDLNSLYLNSAVWEV